MGNANNVIQKEIHIIEIILWKMENVIAYHHTMKTQVEILHVKNAILGNLLKKNFSEF